jgi:hypothetical protein
MPSLHVAGSDAAGIRTLRQTELLLKKGRPAPQARGRRVSSLLLDLTG